MERTNRILAAFCVVMASAGLSEAKPATSIELWRLDCGKFEVKNIGGRPRTLSNGCYLIRHGSDYMIWDVGLDDRLVGKPDISDQQTISLERGLLTQLAQLRIKSQQIGRIAISHRHDDHYGQAKSFPSATLIIGREDWAAIRGNPEEAELVSPWIAGKSRVVEVDGDYDVFGDGRVVIIATPGHTLGHKSLLVHLASGALLLTGDAVHFREQLESRQPSGNHVDKVRGVQSIDRMLLIERHVPARIIVQHDPGDIGRLPAFPKSSK